VPYELEVDWLVAGSGAAGMTGAIAAHQLGGSVLLVEKERHYGGTTCKSGGVAWLPGNHRQVELGISDSPEEGWQYLHALIGDSVSPARLRAFATRAGEMLDFMTRHSRVEFTPLPEYMDYYESAPGYKPGGRSMDPGAFSLRELGAEADHIRDDYSSILRCNITVPEGRRLGAMGLGTVLVGLQLYGRYWLDLPARLRGKRDQRVTLGAGLVARLRRSLMDRDIPLWLNAPVSELLVDNGRVIGAVVTRDGVAQRIHARRGVLLATGGFSHNAEMRRTYQQAPIGSEWTAAAPGATGDGIRLGQELGAALGFMGSAWWSPTYRMPKGPVLALIAGKAYPGSIMVNKKGLRFTNEAQPYEDVVKDQYASELRGEGAVPCYLVFDARYRQQYPVGHIKPGKMVGDGQLPEDLFSSGLLTRAESLEALAAALDIDAAGLAATVERFNRHAREGRDPDYGRGDTEHDRYYADPKVLPNPSLGPLETAPYYALRCDAGDLDTKGGLLCDEHARVLEESGAVIPGLYAAGNTSAAVMGDTYPGAGATIGSAMTFAYLAAQHAFTEEGAASE
jgi:3-oxosteroid 1-dehydrogenase